MGQLILVCGEWKLARKRWYFIVDVQRGSRMILAEDRMRYENLIGMVFDDYGLDKTEYDVKLSYMLGKEVMQKLPQDTPPVYISNCRQLQLFLGQSAENCRRLCVELKEKLDMKLTSENAAQLEESCLKEQDEIPKEEQNLDEDSDEDYAFRFDYCDDSDGTDSGDENFEAFGLVHEEVIEEDEEVKEEEEAYNQEEDEVKAGEDDENLKLPPKKRGGPLFVSEGNASVGNIVKFDLNKLELCDGQCFDTKEQLVTRMKILSVVHKFDFDVHKSTPSLLAAKCWVKGCSWRVRATPKGDYPRFHVRKYVPHHTCSVTERSGRSRQGTHEILALLYKDFVGGVGPSVLPMHVAEALNKRFQTKVRGRF